MLAEQVQKIYSRSISHIGSDFALASIEQAVEEAFAAGKAGNMSPKKAIIKHGALAKQALDAEIKQILDKDIFMPKMFNSLTQEEIDKIVISFAFCKEKWASDGDLEKVKARLVAGGHMVDKGDFDNLASPTARLETSMLLHALAAQFLWFICVLDVVGAYLNTRLPPEQRIHMRLGPEEAAAVVRIHPEWKPFLRKDGSMIVQLQGGLYGLPQASLLWFQMISRTFASLGYVSSQMDPCLFIKIEGGKRSFIVLHVDDIAHFYELPKFQVELEAALTREYGPPTVQRGNSGTYLGVEYEYDRDDGSVRLTMKKYIDKLLAQYNVQKASATPASADFMDIDTESPRYDSKKFASLVMAIYYMAARVRKDILFHVTVLACRISDCRDSDLKKLNKIMRYLYGTRERGIVLRCRGTTLHFHVDAAYSIHANARSHSGLYVTLGGEELNPPGIGGPIFCRSVTQKLVTLSSFEAELNAVHQNVTHIPLFRSLMADLGFDQSGPSILFQDNQATILVIQRGQTFKGRSKHIDVRYFYIKELIDAGVIRVVYCPTALMLADALSKNMHSLVELVLLRSLCNDSI
jgi:hypothetical protein